MINTDLLLKVLKSNQISFITGVPDSVFKSVCFAFEKKINKKKHIPASNEGSAIGLAIGYHLATNNVPLVYFQNSGIGNAINPLTSLVNKKVYNIPLILLIGWRGELKGKNQIKDEPQHLHQGKITEKQLALLGISHIKINSKSNINKIVKKAKNLAIKKSQPVAILVRKNTFTKNDLNNKSHRLIREKFLKELYNCIPSDLPKISTTGMLSRELYELNKFKKTSYNTFMCVGGMGHAVSVANGVAHSSQKKKVFCLDGDGAVIMHMGSMITAAKCKNLIHILFNNNGHDSVGGQMTAGENLNFHKIAKSIGYSNVYKVDKLNQIPKIIKNSLKAKNSSFIEIVCGVGHRKNLVRPNESPIFNKKKFMNYLGSV